MTFFNQTSRTHTFGQSVSNLATTQNANVDFYVAETPNPYNVRYFDKAGNHAAIFGTRLLEDFRAIFGADFGWRPELDALELARRIPKDQLPVLYLTCGTEDGFYSEHLRFCKALREADVPFVFEEWKAAHDFSCFDLALKKAIQHFQL